MFSKMKMANVSSKRFILPLLIACGFLMSACAEKEAPKTPISIEGVVVSESGSPTHKDAIDQFLKEKTVEITTISSKFSAILNGNVTLDESNTTTINAMKVPSLSVSGKSIYNDHAIPEKLSAEIPGAVATVFVRSGDEFVRISTSLKKSDSGQPSADEVRAVGSSLDHKHPAYKTCLEGNTYTGTVTLFGSIYMAEYNPIKNAAGSVIGIKFVGMDISSDVVLLKRKLTMQ
jgi:methyl-accepting chemotaxis protein